jgi:hypothetical protein
MATLIGEGTAHAHVFIPELGGGEKSEEAEEAFDDIYGDKDDDVEKETGYFDIMGEAYGHQIFEGRNE